MMIQYEKGNWVNTRNIKSLHLSQEDGKKTRVMLIIMSDGSDFKAMGVFLGAIMRYLEKPK